MVIYKAKPGAKPLVRIPKFLPGLNWAKLSRRRNLLGTLFLMALPPMFAGMAGAHHFLYSPDIVVNHKRKNAWEPQQDYYQPKRWKFLYVTINPEKDLYACPGPVIDEADYTKPPYED